MHELFPLDIHNFLAIAVRAGLVYVAVVGLLRVVGKRHVGQLSLLDFVLVLLLSNAVQNAMVGPDTSVSGGLVAACVLLGVNLLFSRLIFGRRQLAGLLEGEPTLLVRDGHILAGHLGREGIRPEELEAVVREHGIDSMAHVHQAVLEIDGSISVIAKADRVHERRLPPPRSHRSKHLTGRQK
jgi:uncharacterized membrane protein YcaP (DUF421 family)